MLTVYFSFCIFFFQTAINKSKTIFICLSHIVYQTSRMLIVLHFSFVSYQLNAYIWYEMLVVVLNPTEGPLSLPTMYVDLHSNEQTNVHDTS